MAAEQQATNVPVTDLPVPGSRTTGQAGSTMDIDMVDADTAGVRDGDGKTKRKADDEAHADGNKRARVGQSFAVVCLWSKTDDFEQSRNPWV